MKTFKTILLILLGVILVLLTTTLFVKKEYSVERKIIINQPLTSTFDYVVKLKNQNNYSKWAQMDSTMQTYFKGTDAEVGFISGWKGDITGSGEQEITNIIPGKRIDYKLRFFEPFESEANVYMITDSLSENSTEIKWGFSGKMNYPMNLMLLFVDFNTSIGNDYDEGLQNLKNILENK